jgi:hypothetical protein
MEFYVRDSLVPYKLRCRLPGATSVGGRFDTVLSPGKYR